MTSEEFPSTSEISNVRDFTSYRLQRLIDESQEVAEVLTYAEILFGYENGNWEIEWIGGRPFPVGTEIEFWDKDLNPVLE